jgi:hypothetical protein
MVHGDTPLGAGAGSGGAYPKTRIACRLALSFYVDATVLVFVYALAGSVVCSAMGGVGVPELSRY